MNEALREALDLPPYKPPTDQAIRHAWKCWHFLGDEHAHHKAEVLLTTTTYRWSPDLVALAAHYKKQFRQFLDRKTYQTSVDLIQVWCGLQTSLKTTHQLHADLIESNLRWEFLDDQTAGRLAIVRASRHVAATGELDPQARSPDVRTIRRYLMLRDEYMHARNAAMELLMAIAFPPSLRTRKIRTIKSIQYDETTDDHPRGLGIPRAVPWESEIAQLAALKRVSPKALREFMVERFLQLTYKRQKLFLRQFHAEPRRARKKCGTVAPRLADNAPLLRQLKNQWNDVELLVNEFFPAEHRPSVLRTFASKHGIKLGFKAGSNFVNTKGLTQHQIRPLLTIPIDLA